MLSLKKILVKILSTPKIVHSVYHGSQTLQCSGTTYYNLFPNLEAGLWLITISFYTYSGLIVLCYGNSVNNIICENGQDGTALGSSGAGIVELTSQTTIQMYVTVNTTLYRFKAEAIKLR